MPFPRYSSTFGILLNNNCRLSPRTINPSGYQTGDGALFRASCHAGDSGGYHHFTGIRGGDVGSIQLQCCRDRPSLVTTLLTFARRMVRCAYMPALWSMMTIDMIWEKACKIQFPSRLRWIIIGVIAVLRMARPAANDDSIVMQGKNQWA